MGLSAPRHAAPQWPRGPDIGPPPGGWMKARLVTIRGAITALYVLAGLTSAAPLRAQGVLTSIPLAGGAQGMEFNSATNRLYVAVSTLNQLMAIDGTTNATLASIPVGIGPSAVAVNT